MPFYEKLKNDLEEYPEFAEKLKEYFEQRSLALYKDIKFALK
jgi:hypothetical protein